MLEYIWTFELTVFGDDSLHNLGMANMLYIQYHGGEMMARA